MDNAFWLLKSLQRLKCKDMCVCPVCPVCRVCVYVCVRALLVCLCPSGCDCAGDDDNGCPWDVEAKSLQATLPGLTEHPDIFIHLFFCSVSLASV